MKNPFILLGILGLALISFIFYPSCQTGSDGKSMKYETTFTQPIIPVVANQAVEQPETSDTVMAEVKPIKNIRVYKTTGKSDGRIGRIAQAEGKQGGLMDSPTDNIFRVIIDTIRPNEIAWLEYDLFGLADYTSVSRGINDQLSYGGLIVKRSNEWNSQKEQISLSALRQGENIIRFTLPENANYGYKIRNLHIRLEKANDSKTSARQLVINQPTTNYFYEGKGYVKGYVKGRGWEKAKVSSGSKRLTVEGGQFEGLIELRLEDSSSAVGIVEAEFADGQKLQVEVQYHQPAIYDLMREEAGELVINQELVKAGEAVDFSVGKLKLQGEAGSVSRNTRLKGVSLRSIDMPVMGSGLVNVTGAHKGYRLLPHGTQFAKPIKIAIPYDSASLPVGYSPKDIRSYYFDESNGKWTALPYDTVDMANCQVISYTNHFTDFINGILKVPEAPQTNAYTPTTLSGLSAANPLSGMNILSPPQANNRGTANLNYQIQLPKGRNGMEPQLSISYSNENGNGVLGLGWGIIIPSIDVETRWGVPLYDDNLETESYLISGDQLTPLAHRATYEQRSQGSKQFDRRVKGSFDKITRHGSTPSEYWWEVIDRNGIKYYYGKYSHEIEVNSGLVMEDQSGNISHWALAEVRDSYGNFIRYSYFEDDTKTTVNNGQVGKQFYIENISYTGHKKTEGNYSVSFVYDNGQTRVDKTSSARNGYLQVTTYLLEQIKIKYKNQFIRDYHMKYKNGAFNKTLLCAIFERNDSTSSISFLPEYSCDLDDNSVYPGIKSHRFDYYELPDQLYGDAVNVPVNLIDGDMSILDYYKVSNEPSIGRTRSWGVNIGGTLSVGGGANVATKDLSAGGNYNYTYNNSQVKSTLMDIDGDGYPDRVLRQFGEVYYRKLQNINGTLSFSSLNKINGLEKLGKTTSNSHTFGGEGHLGPISASYSETHSSQISKSYFADVNADGYVDYIDEANVYINYPNQDGTPNFSQSYSDTVFVSGSSCNYILRNGEIDENVYTYDEGDIEKYGRDGVRVWVAPFDGEIKVYSKIRLIKDKSYSRKQSKFVDGIGYAIQYNGAFLEQDTINENNYLPKEFQSGVISILKGEEIFFRLQSHNNRSFDVVDWNPCIYYENHNGNIVDTNETDINGHKRFVFRPSDDLLFQDRQKFMAPYEGDIKVFGHIVCPALNDSLFIYLVQNQDTLSINAYADGNAIYHTIDEQLSVQENDQIEIIAYTNTNVDFNNLMYNVKYQYVLTTDPEVYIDTNNTYDIIEKKPIVKYNLYQDIIKDANLISINGSQVTFSPNISFIGSPSGSFIFTVKKYGRLLGKKTLNYQQGYLQGNGDITINISSATDVEVCYTTENQSIANSINTAAVTINNINYDANVHTIMPDSMWKFGNLYRGWGQFSYLGNELSPIDESKLYLNKLYNTGTPTINTSSMSDFQEIKNALTASNINNPKEETFNMMFVDRDSMLWYDYARYSGIGKIRMTNSHAVRFTQDTIYDSPLIFSINGTTENIKNIGKETQEKNYGFSYSETIPIYSQGVSFTSGHSSSMMDYVDLNGDRFPDAVGNQNVQYTYSYGGWHANAVQGIMSDFQKSSFSGGGNSFGVNLPFETRTNNTASLNIPYGAASYSSIRTRTKQPSSGGSGSLASSTSADELILVDINGDGLLDKVQESDAKVYLNKGYGFLDSEVWNYITVGSGESSSNSVSASGGFGYSGYTTNSLNLMGTTLFESRDFNKTQYSWSGGINVNWGHQHGQYTLLDINADGLPDLLKSNGNDIYVKINNGNSFSLDQIVSNNDHYNFNTYIGGSGFIAGSGGITFGGAVKVVLGIQLGGSVSFQTEKARFMDINNDGYPDFVTTTEQGIDVQYSNLGNENLLKKVYTPVKSTYTINYDLTNSTQENPNRKRVMSSLIIYDGSAGDGSDNIEFAYTYNDGYYDRFERTFYGFGELIEEQLNSDSPNKYVYRTSTKRYINNDFNLIGRMKYESIKDSANALYFETKYTYTGSDCDGPIGYNFPALLAIDQFYYEGLISFQIHTRQEFTYDQYANVIRFYDKRDTTITSDDIESLISYEIVLDSNLLSLPHEIIIQDYNRDLLRNRIATYNAYGSLESLSIINGTNTSTYNLSYDSYGNVIEMNMPENYRGQSFYYSYIYETENYTFPATIEDGFGYESTTNYDFRLQVPTETTDISGNTIEYQYFTDGKLQYIRGPYEIANNLPYLIKYEYWDHVVYSPSNPQPQPWAITKNYDPEISGNEFITVLIADGTGKVLQTKKSSIVDDGQGGKEQKFIVSGWNIYDPYGRVVYSYYPTTEGMTASTTLNTTIDQQNATRIYYDVLDRKTRIRMPDLTSNYMFFGFGQDGFNQKQFMNTIRDANGIDIISFNNVIGKQTTIKAPHYAKTKFIYNPLGELLESIDPEGNSTSYTYDKAGQLLGRAHPDAGTTSYTYDDAGNLMSTQTENLNAKSQYIIYNYDHNRLMKVEYPENPENNVFYQYGSSGNNTGRIEKVQDASGVQEFFYGSLGEVIENIRTFVVPNGEKYSFAMEFEYDSWGRIQHITYPDGEDVGYAYDIGGQLTEVRGVKGNQSYDYLVDIHYDKFGKRVQVEYGNGTYSVYSYEAQMQKLINLTTTDANKNVIQEIAYTYDDVSNITQIENTAGVVSGLGGEYSYQYSYDSLYRLISSSGSFDPTQPNEYPFSLSMSYSSSGNILGKTLSVSRLMDGVPSSVSYDNSYNYGPNQPHAVASVIDNGTSIDYTWDANGNLTQRNSATETRYLCWDEENRLTTVKDKSYLSSYIYDAGGERVWKLTGAVEEMQINGSQFVDMVNINDKTLYTSPYLVLTEQEYTKHFYAGSQRLASKLGAGLADALIDPMQYTPEFIDQGTLHNKRDSLYDMIARGWDCTGLDAGYVSIENTGFEIVNEMMVFSADEEETDLYFYHTDHLGSSSWITDASGSANQHLQYLPYGEDYIYQRTNSWNVPYTFSSKEKDVETGYSYFGARYYDSDLSIWLSVDPLADKYPSMSGYMYTAGNPVMLVDPDGMRIWVFTKDGQKLKYKNNELYERKGLFKWKKYEGDDDFAIAVKDDLNKLKSIDDEANKIISHLEKSKRNHNIKESKTLIESSTSTPENKIKAQFQIKTGSTISYSFLSTYNPDGERDPIVGLAHELEHSFEFDTGKLNYNEKDASINLNVNPQQYAGIASYECRAVQFENKIRKKLYNPNNPGYNEQRIIHTNKMGFSLLVPPKYLKE